MKTKVSIIMPALNTARWIGQALESVLRQKDPDWELIAVDNGSTDGTRQILAGYAACDKRIRILPNAWHRGPGGARNTGIENARGNALMFLDSDDVMFPDAVGSLYQDLKRHKTAVVRGRGAAFCHQRLLAVHTYTPRPENDAPGPMIFPPAAFWHHIYDKAFLLKNNIRFNDAIIGSEDRMFICRVYAQLGHVPSVNSLATIYRINHKPMTYSPAKSMEFALCTAHVREIFERYGRTSWIAPYIDEIFLSEWLDHVHVLLKKSTEDALWFMEQTKKLLAGYENTLSGAMSRSLGKAASPFLRAVASGDTQWMLDLLRDSGVLFPPSTYMGIERRPDKPGWRAYILLRRLINLLRASEPSRTLLYFAWLDLCCMRRGAAAPG